QEHRNRDSNRTAHRLSSPCPRTRSSAWAAIAATWRSKVFSIADPYATSSLQGSYREKTISLGRSCNAGSGPARRRIRRPSPERRVTGGQPLVGTRHLAERQGARRRRHGRDRKSVVEGKAVDA